MNDALIIQQVNTNSPYLALVMEARSQHTRYAIRHHMDYEFTPEDVGDDGKQGCWSKVRLVQRALAKYKYVFWIDADALIYDMERDLRDACQFPISTCVYHNPFDHYQVGVMYFRSEPQTVEFVDAWLNAYPGTSPWWEQGGLNELVKLPEWEGVIGEIPAIWNMTPTINPVDDPPVVVAFHGYGTSRVRHLLIKQYLKRLEIARVAAL